MANPAIKGNRFWEARSTHGRKPIFGSPEELLKCSMEYIRWVEDNPLYEAKAFHYQGEVVIKEIPKMRAMTIGSLCLFLDIGADAWGQYKTRSDGFAEVTKVIIQCIKEQKFGGAAANLLNANIIARDLGMVDKKEISGSIANMNINSDMDPKEAAKLYSQMIKSDGEDE